MASGQEIPVRDCKGCVCPLFVGANYSSHTHTHTEGVVESFFHDKLICINAKVCANTDKVLMLKCCHLVCVGRSIVCRMHFCSHIEV